jgi:hypothetical protein
VILTGRRFLAKRPVSVVVVVFVAVVASTLAHVRVVQSLLVTTQATQNAELLTGTVAEFRTVYMSEVLERLRPAGVEITHDYFLQDGAIPLPATLSMMLGNRIGRGVSSLQGVPISVGRGERRAHRRIRPGGPDLES